MIVGHKKKKLKTQYFEQDGFNIHKVPIRLVHSNMRLGHDVSNEERCWCKPKIFVAWRHLTPTYFYVHEEDRRAA